MTSRIYVQGLPNYLDERRLRETFAEKGEVTDAKIIRTRDGRSRQFGFVGFPTVEQAEQAITYFNNSYVDTARIQVKFAEQAQSASLGRPWSQHSQGSTAFKKKHKAVEDDKPKVRELLKQKRGKYQQPNPAEDDVELAEFLEVMQPRRAAAMWANDDITARAAKPAAAPTKKRKQPEGGPAGVNTDDEDDALFQDLPEAAAKGVNKGRGSAKRAKQQTPDQVGKETADKELEEDDPPEGPEKPLVANVVAAVDDVSDLEYLKSRKQSTAAFEEAEGDQEKMESDTDEEAEGSETSEDGPNSLAAPEAEEAGIDQGSEGQAAAEDAQLQDRRRSHQAAGPADADEEGEAPISETGRLFLRNLPYSATEADLARLFEAYGDLSEVHLVLDRATRKSKGIALVQFMDPKDAEAAFAALDGSIFQGRLLHVLPAKPPPASAQTTVTEEEGAEGARPRGYRQQREADQRADAGNRVAWNTLFMRPDTVAEAVAAHYGVSKSQLLDRDAADLPVRLALGETHVIAITKAALAEAGVSLEALEDAATRSGSAASSGPSVDRSETVILVKNLPYSASEGELMEVFGSKGRIARLVLPATRTLALVEFREAADARRAFKTLAYKRFHAVPLYLEWAPKDIFTAAPALPKLGQQAQKKAGEGKKETVVDANLLRGATEEEVESSTLFVKNLAWSTGDKALAKHFDSTVSAAGGSIRAARVAKRAGADGKPLSAGYGFVECSSETVAKLTLRKLQGSLLEGHKLVLQLSMKKGAETKPAVKGEKKKKKAAKGSTKVVVRNVAFEATAKEIRALFQPFGQIKSVRLPRKFDNSHRGFAFVDFLSHQEAVNAMEAVAGAHLYGRRLVVEFANPDEALEDIRAKAAAQLKVDA